MTNLGADNQITGGCVGGSLGVILWGGAYIGGNAMVEGGEIGGTSDSASILLFYQIGALVFRFLYSAAVHSPCKK